MGTVGVTITVEMVMCRLIPWYLGITLVCVTMVCGLEEGCSEDWDILCQYGNHSDVINGLKNLASLYPRFARYGSIGRSVEGRDLGYLVIARDVHMERKILRPMVQMVGNMHGDETVGRQLVYYFAHYLLTHQHKPEIQFLLNHTEFHLLPTLNPDGFTQSPTNPVNTNQCVHKTKGRRNAQDADLNRSFPDIWDTDKAGGEVTVEDFLSRTKEPEVEAMVRWSLQRPFALSVNFHGGAVVASYPWDSVDPKVLTERGLPHRKGYSTNIPSPTQDDDMYRELAREYSRYHPRMYNQTGLERCLPGIGGPFTDGITNGADWYGIRGTMQDFQVKWTNVMALTMEVSCCKHPHPQELTKYWNENLISMVKFSEKVHSGVKGRVLDTEGNPVVGAQVMVQRLDMEGNLEDGDRRKVIVTTSRGEYWKLVPEGSYSVRVVACTGYTICHSHSVNIVVTRATLTEALIVNLIVTVKEPNIEINNITTLTKNIAITPRPPTSTSTSITTISLTHTPTMAPTQNSISNLIPSPNTVGTTTLFYNSSTNPIPNKSSDIDISLATIITPTLISPITPAQIKTSAQTTTPTTVLTSIKKLITKTTKSTSNISQIPTLPITSSSIFTPNPTTTLSPITSTMNDEMFSLPPIRNHSLIQLLLGGGSYVRVPIVHLVPSVMCWGIGCQHTYPISIN